MTQTIVTVIAFLALLAFLPLGVRWFQRRMPGAAVGGPASRVISTVAVGPQQRVVTVEVGPEDGRTWLVIGVTPQNVTCLHVMVLAPAKPAFAATPVSASSSEGQS